MSKKIKTHVLMVAKSFLKGHPRAGEPTDFAKKILNGEKIHTIRGSFENWEKKVNEVNAGDAILSVRSWTGKPYRTPQETICEFKKLGIERTSVLKQGNWCEVVKGYASKSLIALNDGLMRQDFDSWFKEGQDNMALIHFTDFRYCGESEPIIQTPDGTVVAIEKDFEKRVKDISVRGWEQIKGH
jgi:hypothetical protein